MIPTVFITRPFAPLALHGYAELGEDPVEVVERVVLDGELAFVLGSARRDRHARADLLGELLLEVADVGFLGGRLLGGAFAAGEGLLG